MTHEVLNQSPPLAGTNAWRADPLLVQVAESFAEPVRKDLDRLGRFVRTAEAQEMARLANTETPKLRTHDRQGRRVDLVEFHPAYHALMRQSVAIGLHSSVWENTPGEAGKRHQVRAARFFMTAQLECGHLCPITMTSASLAAMMANPKLFREWAPRVTTRKYDQTQKPPVQKTGLTLGMGMTEKQGGTDVRANTTRAERAGNGFYRLTGHKWFMSAPMSDAFLMLAQTGEGLSCFLVPRILGDGSNNGLHFQRLKDKLGNRSNASSEVEFAGAIGEMVGDPGAGVKTIMDMVTLTRLDCAVANAGIMRAGLAEAVHHTRNRMAFGAPLFEQPLMQRVLADMALDVAGATALAFRLARSFDEAARDPGEAAFARAMTPVVKYWVCKRTPGFVNEAQECLGGIGYVEENILPRLYRQAPLNSIWEGSGNVQCLDVLRALRREPETREALFAELQGVRGEHKALDRQIDWLKAAFDDHNSLEGRSRMVVERTAMALQAAQLVKTVPGQIGALFGQARMGEETGHAYGTLDPHGDMNAIIDRVLPH